MWTLPALGRSASEPSLKQYEVICYTIRLVFSRRVMTNLLLLTSPHFDLYIGEEFYFQFWEGNSIHNSEQREGHVSKDLISFHSKQGFQEHRDSKRRSFAADR